VLRDGELIATFPGQTSGSITITPHSRLSIGGISGGCETTTTTSGGTTTTSSRYWLDLDLDFSISDFFSVAVGDRVEIVLDGDPAGPPLDISVLAHGLANFNVQVVETPTQIAFGDALSNPYNFGSAQVSTTGVFASAVPASGPIELQGADLNGDGLADFRIDNLGSSGQDGVELLWLGVESASVEVLPLNPDVLGSCLRFRSILNGGLEGGTVLLDPDQDEPDFFAISPDFAGVGAGTYRLQIFDQGNLVWNQPGMSGQAASSSFWPRRLGKLGGLLPCLQLCYPFGTQFSIAGSETMVFGDDVRLLAEGASSLPLIDSFEITAANMQGLVLSNPASELPAACSADLNGDGQLDFFDVQAFLNFFASQDPRGDFNADGQFDFFDVQAFLNAYSAGCP
jgi:hypothetical protein